MQINDLSSNAAVKGELAKRLKRARIDAKLTQEDLANRSGISKRTIANVEKGSDVTLDNLLNVLRALGLLGRVDLLVPQEEIRPSVLLAQRKQRQRVRSPKSEYASIPWKWGDEE